MKRWTVPSISVMGLERRALKRWALSSSSDGETEPAEMGVSEKRAVKRCALLTKAAVKR